MDALVVAGLVAACLFGGAIAGMWGARRLEERHLSKETQEAVKLGIGMVAAMASLILGLMTASVKGNFDTTTKDVQQFATYLLTIDEALRHYGPGAEGARIALRDYTAYAIAQTWPERGGAAGIGGAPSEQRLAEVGRLLRALDAGTPEQTELRAEAVERYKSLAALRWVLIAESVSQVPPVFTGVLIVWLTLIFASFGLFAPVNRVSVVVFLLCALSLGGALFLILEMSSPYDGIIVVPSLPMRQALQHMSG